MPTLEDIAMWIGEMQINLRMAQKKIRQLMEENQNLNAEIQKRDSQDIP